MDTDAYQLSSLAVSKQEPSGDHFTPLRKFVYGHKDRGASGKEKRHV